MRLGLGLGARSVVPGAPAWHPSQENFGLLLMPGDYSTTENSGTWTGTASAGASAGRSLTSAVNTRPDAVDGSPVWTSGRTRLRSDVSVTLASVATASAGTFVVIARSSSYGSFTQLLADGGGYAQAYLTNDLPVGTTNQMIASMSGGTVANVDASPGAWHIHFLRWDGVHVQVRTDDGEWGTADYGNVPTLTGRLEVGNFSPTSLAERLVAISPTALSDDACDRFYAWAITEGLLV